MLLDRRNIEGRLRLPGRRWLQFGLRTVLVCTLVACVPLSWCANKLLRVRRQRLAVNAIAAAGARVWYIGADAAPSTASLRYGFQVVPYDSQQPDASRLDRLIAEARAGEVVAVDFGATSLQHSFLNQAKRHQVDIDGQYIDSGASGEWILHGETDRYGRRMAVRSPRQFSWHDLRLLDSLEILSIGDRPITDADMSDIGTLKRLRCLIIEDGRAVTNAGLTHLRELVHLRVLVIDRSQVTDEGLAFLHAFRDLEVLELDHAPIQGDGLANLVGLQNLRLISLRFAPLEDQGLTHLTGLTKLERLYLFNTRLTDAGLEHLAGLEALEVLHLGRTAVSFQGANALEKRLGRSPIIR